VSRVIAVVACGLAVAGCSVSMPSLNFLKSSSEPQALRIESEPPGANAKSSSGQSCRTPCELAVQGSNEFSVSLALDGYHPQTVSVRSDGDEAKLAPNPIHVELQPAVPPKKTAKKKKSVAAARPAKPPPTTTASAAPPPMPATPPTPAASGWPSR
jgi:hypothetical protein